LMRITPIGGLDPNLLARLVSCRPQLACQVGEID
jgi:hypothetical protein